MKISFVTTNKGKYNEISQMIQQRGHEAEQLPTPYPEIQAESLEMVVLQGLYWLMRHFNRPVLVDDSGLFVDVLKGFPGVYSSYAYKSMGCDGILRLMEAEKNRKARFECVLGFMDMGEDPMLFKGVSEGSITTQKRGDMGFGFDPIFVPEGHSETFAEMAMGRKNELSHRGRAFEKFFDSLG